MAIRFNVALDVRRFAEDLDALGRRGPALMARAINRAGISGKTAVVKAVAADTGLPQKNVERDLKIDKANPTAPQLTITVLGRRIPLIAFQARGPEPSKGRGRGVSYRLPGARGRIANAFIATMPGGHRGVYKRRGTGRLPIRELFGPSIPKVFEKFLGIFGTVSAQSFEKNLEHEIAFAKSKEEAA